jgi:hypothetical protein
VFGQLLQDFISVKAAASTSIVQTSTSWLDIGDLEDLVFYVDCKEAFNGPKLGFDTSPTPLDSQFTSLVAPFSLATGLQTTSVLAAYASVPPLRYVRWRVLGDAAVTTSTTFRIWVAGYGWA